ncbi:conserved hypothetical protein [Microsporum canis CBS 113480]|uniref:N-acetyltransferase domain-containing protein n=1 Tax=Arthroderma otae (strain ATCC MYA-4605 / CBS 113480) TaxID=554155 RepID=C5FPV5_ARTOC|nr:conserved hypothetical protein [Microsporum canis CBS 113480]EEQ31710.1 conserved hypothetical protein [Microsporum canis CBS 113480]
MPIRLARYSDLEAISSALAEGFHEEEVMGPLLHPYRQEYPVDYLNYWRRKCLEKWWNYSYVFIVSFIEQDQKPDEREDGRPDDRSDDKSSVREVITGVAQWHRMGPGWEAIWKPLGRWDPRALYASPPHRQVNWSLSCLAVRPKYQRLGHGRELVAWGLDRAREEGIAASVLAAKGKDTFYRRCGFTELAGWATDGEGNPLKGVVEGGAVMFTRVKEDDL